MIIDRAPIPNLPDPFDVSAVLLHCRLSDDMHAYIEAQQQARAAALEIESYAAIALLYQTIYVTLKEWPDVASMALPIAPLLDPSTVTVSALGEPFDSFTITGGMRPRIWIDGAAPFGDVVIQYQAGFGSLVEDIPADLALAIMDQAMAFYDNRGAGDGKSDRLSPHAARVAARYRRVAL